MNQNNQIPKSIDEMPIEERDYVEIMDGFGVKHKHVNFSNPKYCKREGIVEFVPMRYAKGIAGQPKHDNYKAFKKVRDRRTKYIWGVSTNGVNPETKLIEYDLIVVEGAILLDCTIEEDAIKAAMIMNGPYCEGSPNLVGKPTYKVRDKERIAETNINKRTNRRKAEDIALSLNRKQLLEMATNMGINVTANPGAMLEEELFRVIDLDPAKFIRIWENKDREYISIFKKALSVGVIIHNVTTGIYMYNGLEMGHNEDMAVKYLVDNRGIATTISTVVNENEVKSHEAMGITKSKSDQEELAKLKAELAELKKIKLADSIIKGENEGKTFTEPDEELQSLRERAKELKIPGYNLPTMTKEKLRAKIEEAESKSS